MHGISRTILQIMLAVYDFFAPGKDVRKFKMKNHGQR